MGRQKKVTSRTLDKARTRLAGITSIDPNFDLGNGKTKTGYETVIKKCDDSLKDYNGALSTADEKYNIFLANQKELDTVNEAMLIGVADKYGKNSDEYEKAGGVKKSERKKPVRKPKK